MKKIITISREFGAGGGEIGRKVAERLGYHYYDKELILRSADTSKVDVESMRRWDEKVPANFGFAQSLFNFYMPAPDILALNAVTGQVLRTAHGLVKPNGHGIAAMQRHAFHRRFGQAVAHIHGSVGFHCAAQLRHAQGQHIQRSP